MELFNSKKNLTKNIENIIINLDAETLQAVYIVLCNLIEERRADSNGKLKKGNHTDNHGNKR